MAFFLRYFAPGWWMSEVRRSSYALLERLPVPVLVADDQGRYTFANHAACDLLGRSAQELVGLTIRDVAPETVDVESAWGQFLGSGRQEGEFQLLDASGRTVTVRFRAVASFEPGQHISMLDDITDRKRVEAQLRHNEELYIKLFNASPAPTNLRELASGRFVEVNQAFTDVTGYFRADVIGRTQQSLGLWKDRQTLEKMMQQLRNGDAVQRTRAQLITRDRAVREFSICLRRVEVFGTDHVIATYTDMATI